jgi:hypothetical protein
MKKNKIDINYIINYLYKDKEMNDEIKNIVQKTGDKEILENIEDFKSFIFTYLFEKDKNHLKLINIYKRDIKEFQKYIYKLIWLNINSKTSPWAVFNKNLKTNDYEIFESDKRKEYEYIYEKYNEIPDNIRLDDIYTILYDTSIIKWWQREIFMIYFNLNYKSGKTGYVSYRTISEEFAEMTGGKLKLNQSTLFNIVQNILEIIKNKLKNRNNDN